MGLFKGAKFTSRSNKIDAFQSTVCEFGTPVPLLFGTCKVSPNLMCYQDFETKEKRTTQKSGKSKSTTITYLYYVYAELALGEGVISGINKVWVGDTAYAGLGALNANTNNEGAGLALNKGDNNQPTTYMSTNHADIATGYDNLAYLYGRIFLGEDNASMPSYSFEVRGSLIADNTDANPAYVIKDILSKIGLGSYIDEASFADYAKYCANADLLISTPNDAFSRQDKAQTIIANLLEITNTYMYWSVDRFKFAVRDDVQRAEWSPNTQIMYDLTADDFIPQSGSPIIVKRKDSTEIYNYITVNFLNRANDYEEESVSYQDLDSIKTYGVRSVSYDAKWYHTKARALKYAQMKTRMAQTECNQYTFRLPWKYCRLEPGDLLRITDEAIGIAGQVVMVSEITEAKTGILTVTAVQRAPGAYSEAKYTVVNDYQYQDFNVEPGNTARPLFIIPPSDLVTSASGCELWIALQGAAKTWGGCNVFASTKDGDYSHIGTQGVNSIYGTTAGTMTDTADTAYIRLNNQRPVELLTGSAHDAVLGNTLIWINGECMSYTRATLLDSNLYQLTGLIRGQYGTTAKAHNYGEDVAVLDGGIYVVPLTKQHIGRTLYFKFPAFNEFKANGQNLSDVDCYSCVAAVSDLPNCTDVTAYNKYRDVGGKIVYHDIIVEWSPDDFDNYQQAQVWYRQYGEAWRYGGSGYKSATLPQVDIGKRYQIAVCTQDIFGNVETPDASAQTSILVAISTATPTAPTNLSVTLKDAVVIKWDEVHNADIKYYEIRLDANVGVDNANFIARTADNSYTTNAITARYGTIYVFAVSAYGITSAPATAAYNFATPAAPKISVKAKMQGIECRVLESIPNNCIGVHWYFDGATNDSDDKTANLSYYKSLDAGVYEVKACYYNYFGDGRYSGSETVTVKATIDAGLIEAGSIAADKLDTAVKNSIANAMANANAALQNSNNALVNANAALSNSNITADKLKKDYSTTTQTETLIATRVANSLGNYSTTEQTANMIAGSIANFKNDTLSQYSTTKQTAAMISSGIADFRDGTLSKYSTTEQTSGMISSSIADFKNDTLSQYGTTKQTEELISSQVASYTDGKLSSYSTIEQTNTAISNMVVKMDAATNKKLESYSTIQQTQDAISLAVKNIDLDGNDIITKINIADGTILLDGKYVHVTGDTQIDGNVITNNMLAGSISADKMAVDSLSAITAKIGELKTADTGARTVIKDNLIEVYDSNNVLRVRMGVWS